MIRSWPCSKVPEKYLDRLRSLTLERGVMWRSFTSSRRRGLGRVYIYFDKNRPDYPLGWLLIRANPPWAPDTNFDVQMFVDPTYRRSGFGRKLFLSATKGREPIAVYPWDGASEDFFLSFPHTRSYEGWYERNIDLTSC